MIQENKGDLKRCVGRKTDQNLGNETLGNGRVCFLNVFMSCFFFILYYVVIIGQRALIQISLFIFTCVRNIQETNTRSSYEQTPTVLEWAKKVVYIKIKVN